jgi:hypothetical protein
MTSSTSLLRRFKRPSIATIPPHEITMSPPPSQQSHSRRLSIDSLDEEYFDKTYVPLSNLPTPPMSNASSRRASYEDGFVAHQECLNPNLLGTSGCFLVSIDCMLICGL